MGLSQFQLQSKKNRGCLGLIQYGNAILGRLGCSKKVARKSPIMNYEQLLSSIFSCFHGLNNNFVFSKAILAFTLRICIK